MGFILSIALIASVQNSEPAPPTGPPRIVVHGYGETRTAPDIATLTYDVVGEGKSSDGAVRSLATKARSVEDALRGLDPELDLRTKTVEVNLVRGDDCDERSYDNAPLSTGKCAIVGYTARQEFEVRTRRVLEAGTMVGAAGREGASTPRIEDFDIADDTSARQSAIAMALADAERKAQAVATGSRTKLGTVLHVELDGASGDEAIVVTGSRQVSRKLAEPIRIDIAPAPITTVARVTVSYSIDKLD